MIAAGRVSICSLLGDGHDGRGILGLRVWVGEYLGSKFSRLGIGMDEGWVEGEGFLEIGIFPRKLLEIGVFPRKLLDLGCKLDLREGFSGLWAFGCFGSCDTGARLGLQERTSRPWRRHAKASARKNAVFWELWGACR